MHPWNLAPSPPRADRPSKGLFPLPAMNSVAMPLWKRYEHTQKTWQPRRTPRLRTDIHDPTVRIENLISLEQGVPARNLRGLAAPGRHRGESVDKITIGNFPFNVTDISASEQNKIEFAARYIFTPGGPPDGQNEYVSILGHSDGV